MTTDEDLPKPDLVVAGTIKITIERGTAKPGEVRNIRPSAVLDSKVNEKYQKYVSDVVRIRLINS